MLFSVPFYILILIPTNIFKDVPFFFGIECSWVISLQVCHSVCLFTFWYLFWQTSSKMCHFSSVLNVVELFPYRCAIQCAFLHFDTYSNKYLQWCANVVELFPYRCVIQCANIGTVLSVIFVFWLVCHSVCIFTFWRIKNMIHWLKSKKGVPFYHWWIQFIGVII